MVEVLEQDAEETVWTPESLSNKRLENVTHRVTY